MDEKRFGQTPLWTAGLAAILIGGGAIYAACYLHFSDVYDDEYPLRIRFVEKRWQVVVFRPAAVIECLVIRRDVELNDGP